MEKVAELTQQMLAVEDGSDLGVMKVLQAEYRLMSEQVDPSSLTDIPLPSCSENVAEIGLVLSKNLPNFIAAYIALRCQHFAWVACENPTLATSGEDIAGIAVVTISVNPDVLPGTLLVWRNGVLKRNSVVDIQSNSSAIQIYKIVEADSDLMVNVEHPKFLDPAYLTQAVLPFVDSNQEPQLGISFTNARPVFLNVYLAWLASKNANFRYVAIFNIRTISTELGRIGSIVVHSRDSQYPVGRHVDNGQYSPFGRGIRPDAVDRAQSFAGLAVAIIGLPNSGKSVLRRSLFDLTMELPNVFSQEANPDGQGNYFQYVNTPEHYARIRHKWDFTQGLADHYCHHIIELREQLNLLWVGMGGKPSIDSAKTLEACTHAILLTRGGEPTPEDDELLSEWHAICERAGVPIIARFESSLAAEKSEVYVRDANGNDAIAGVVAKLMRGDPESIDRCRPIAHALVVRLLADFPEQVPAAVVDRYSQWCEQQIS